MKRYEVYTQYISPIRIEAEKIISYTADDKPSKIKFLIGDETVAEFYAEHIAGWKELEEERKCI